MRYYINGVRVARGQMKQLAKSYFMANETPEERVTRWESLACEYGEYGLSDLYGSGTWDDDSELILTERFSFKVFKN